MSDADKYTVRTCPACDTVQPDGVKLIKCITCGVIYCWSCRLSRAYYHAHDCPIWRLDDEERYKIQEEADARERESSGDQGVGELAGGDSGDQAHPPVGEGQGAEAREVAESEPDADGQEGD